MRHNVELPYLCLATELFSHICHYGGDRQVLRLVILTIHDVGLAWGIRKSKSSTFFTTQTTSTTLIEFHLELQFG